MKVHIGSKFTGRPAAHADTTTGTYWEALPKIDGSMLAWQRVLLAKPRAPQGAVRSVVSGIKRVTLWV